MLECFRCGKTQEDCSCEGGGLFLEGEPVDEEENVHQSHNESVPEGAIINAHVCVDQWIDDTGTIRFAVGYTGTVPMTQLLGLLELAKAAVLQTGTSQED